MATATRAEPTAATAAALVGGALVVPLVFWIGIDEAFVIPKLVTLGVVVAVAGRHALRGRRVPTGGWSLIDVAVTVWVVLVVISHLSSIDRSQSLWGETGNRQGVVVTVLYGLGYLLARRGFGRPGRLGTLLGAIAVAGSIVGAYAIAQRLGLDPLWDEIPHDRAFATIGQPNSLGGFLALSIPATVGVAITHRTRPFGPALAAIALQVVALGCTLSRGGVLGLAVAGAVLASVLLVRAGWQWPATLAVLVAAGTGGAVLLTVTPGLEPVADRVVSRTVDGDEWSTGSIANHLDLWTVAREVIRDDPVIGTGPDTFPLVFGDHRDRVLDAESAQRLRPYRVESPHNVTLATATGSGIPAAVAQLGAWLGAIVLALGGVRVGERPFTTETLTRAAAGAALAGALVASWFITADLTTTWLMWMLTGAIVAGSALAGGAAEHDPVRLEHVA